MLTRVFMTIGVVMLVMGILLYARLAVQGEGSLFTIFGLLMGCLMFFNLPTVLARRRDRGKQKDSFD